MSPPKPNKRLSILKKRASTFESPEASATITTKPRKGILFSQKNTVKEFLQCDEKTTIWGNSYETSIAKSDGSSLRSSDGSSTSKKLSLDFSSSNIQVSSVATAAFDAEKENFIVQEELEAEKENLTVPRALESVEDIRQTLSPMCTSSRNSGLSLENMTVECNADEKKRIKQYGIDNLNITNMQLDTTLSGKDEENMVKSPRKTVFFRDSLANMSVCRQEKEADAAAVMGCCTKDLSFNLETDEASSVKTNRKTILKPDDMDISLSSKRYKLQSDLNSKQEPFKQPRVPKAFSFLSNFGDNVSMNVESPPIKPPNLQNQQQVLDEFMEFMVTDTPTKNLCHQMCSSKKHSITPLNMPPPKVLFSSTRSNWYKRTKSTELLKVLGLDLDTTTTDTKSSLMEETDDNRRRTVFSADISLDEPPPSTLQCTRKTLFEGDIDLTNEELASPPVLVTTPENTFFELESETIAGTKSMTLVKMRDIAESSGENKRKTVFSDDMSYTCNLSGRTSGRKTANSSNNCSNMNETEMSETTAELAAKAARLLKDPMGTAASTSDLFSRTFRQDADINLDESLAKTLRDESLNMSAEYQRQLSSAKKSPSRARHTTYSHDMSLLSQSQLDEENHEHLYLMDAPTCGSFGMDISGIQLTVEIIQRNRLTVYEDSMENVFNEPMQMESKNARKTILDTNTAMSTSYNNDSSFRNNPDSTVGSDSIDVEPLVEPPIIPISKPKSFRATICDNESIVETVNIDPSLLVREPSDGSIVSLNKSVTTKDDKGRLTTYDESLDVSSGSAVITSSHPASQPRKTCYDDQMDETFNDFDVPKPRRNTTNQSVVMQLEETQHYHSGYPEASFNLSSASDKFPSKRNELQRPFDSTFTSARKLQSLDVSVAEVEFIEVAEGTQTMFRKSVIVEAPVRRLPQETANMHVEMGLEESSSSPPNTNKKRKFASEQEDSQKLLNITSAEIVSLIDDETNPSLLNETLGSDVQPLHVSFGDNPSSYQKALQDFVNLTIVNSPLNMSRLVGNHSVGGRVTVHEVPSRIDYSAKLNELMTGLEEKNNGVKPKLPIDEFLDNLNIEPVKIPRLVEMEPGYLMKMLQETNEKLARHDLEKKAEKASQMPQIPAYGFLIDNKLKWMDEEVQLELSRKRRESLIALTPVFPELRDFDFLLNNKFTTDEELSKVWNLELLFAWMSQYKFVHKLMPGYKINITLQKAENHNESTIPIYFEKVLMYKSPNYRAFKSTRTTILMREFHRSIGTDLFTTMCPSEKELFTFLQHFHEQVMKTVSLVDNFIAIIGRHGAILEQHRDGKQLNISHIAKRLFTRDGGDIVDIAIYFHGYIEEISVRDVVVKGLTRYAYELQPRPYISEKKGLLLIELILFDPEKFLLENTRRWQIE